MKIKVTRPDGTVIEAEGTAEECARLLPTNPPAFVPTIWVYPPAYTVTVSELSGPPCNVAGCAPNCGQIGWTANGTAFTAGGLQERS